MQTYLLNEGHTPDRLSVSDLRRFSAFCWIYALYDSEFCVVNQEWICPHFYGIRLCFSLFILSYFWIFVSANLVVLNSEWRPFSVRTTCLLDVQTQLLDWTPLCFNTGKRLCESVCYTFLQTYPSHP